MIIKRPNDQGSNSISQLKLNVTVFKYLLNFPYYLYSYKLRIGKFNDKTILMLTVIH